MNSRLKSSSLILTALVALVGSPLSAAQVEDSSRIVFLNLLLVHDSIMVQSVRVVEGRVKLPKKPQMIDGRLRFRVTTEENKVVYEDVISDPLQRMYEYLDQDGHLQSQIVRSDSAFFFVRFPFHPSVHSVDFEKIERARNSDAYFELRIRRLGTVQVGIGAEGHED